MNQSGVRRLWLGDVACLCNCLGSAPEVLREGEIMLDKLDGPTDVYGQPLILERQSSAESAAESQPRQGSETNGPSQSSLPVMHGGTAEAGSELCRQEGAGSDSTDDHSMAEAVRHGLVLQARRELARRGKPEPAGLREKIDSVLECYEVSLGDLVPDADGWTHEQVDDLQYSYRIGDGQFRLVSTVESNKSDDAVKALAAILEADLCRGYKPNVTSVALLGDPNFDPCDSLWHIRSKGRITGAPEDNIVKTTFVDALDEELGSMWVCAYSVADASTKELDGVRLPSPEPGTSRDRSWRTTFRIGPSRDSKGFRMSSAINFQPSKASQMLLSRMPAWSLRLVMTRCAREILDSFTKHMSTCEELHRRIAESPRAWFYKHLQRRLAGGGQASPLPVLPAELGQDNASGEDTFEISSGSERLLREVKAPSSTAAGSSSATLFDDELAGQFDVPDDEEIFPTWEELSQQLPLDWASYHG